VARPEPPDPPPIPAGGRWMPSEVGLARGVEKGQSTIMAKKLDEALHPRRVRTIADYRQLTREFCYSPSDWASPLKGKATGRALQPPDESAERDNEEEQIVEAMTKEREPDEARWALRDMEEP